MHRVLYWLGNVILGIGLIYGEVGAIRLFFGLQTCYSNGLTDLPTCQWLFAGWSSIVWLPIFVAYLVVTPLVGIYYAFPFYIPGVILRWLGTERPPTARTVHP